MFTSKSVFDITDVTETDLNAALRRLRAVVTAPTREDADEGLKALLARAHGSFAVSEATFRAAQMLRDTGEVTVPEATLLFVSTFNAHRAEYILPDVDECQPTGKFSAEFEALVRAARTGCADGTEAMMRRQMARYLAARGEEQVARQVLTDPRWKAVTVPGAVRLIGIRLTRAEQHQLVNPPTASAVSVQVERMLAWAASDTNAATDEASGVNALSHEERIANMRSDEARRQIARDLGPEDLASVIWALDEVLALGVLTERQAHGLTYSILKALAEWLEETDRECVWLRDDLEAIDALHPEPDDESDDEPDDETVGPDLVTLRVSGSYHSALKQRWWRVTAQCLRRSGHHRLANDAVNMAIEQSRRSFDAEFESPC